jgi:SpoVK/Ycf46/Vps4 family AAA+-type ATPase
MSIANSCHGYTSADLSRLVSLASFYAEERGAPISMQDLSIALKRIQKPQFQKIFRDIPSVRWDDIGGYQEVKVTKGVLYYFPHNNNINMWNRIGFRNV